MEDKQIIELYWNRSGDAIKETKEKYGNICTHIASHILQNEESVDVCVNQSFEKLWENIPPRRPQNLKTYLCKITRNLALQMEYPDVLETGMDLFSAELVIYDFLKGLELEKRKLFVAYYWYFASVSEIATQYKMSQNKVKATLATLCQSLDAELEKKNLKPQTETELLYAMTEMEDKYLEEALPQMEKKEEKAEKSDSEPKALISQIWKKYQIPMIACVIALVFLIFIWPKKPVEQNPTESETFEETTQDIPVTDIELEDLITVFSGGSYSKDDLATMKEMVPWREDMEILALPVYKKISVYDADTFTEKATDLARKLNMNIINTNVVIEGTVVNQVQMVTDKGLIVIDDSGRTTVTYDGEVNLLNKCEMSDSASIKEANENTLRLMMEFGGSLGVEYYEACSYPRYYGLGSRTMNYRAIATEKGNDDVSSILDYYFNEIEFYYRDDIGLTGFCYSDVRSVAEEMGYYPIISLEEAKKQLQEGKYSCDSFDSVQANFEYEEDAVLGVELMYKTDEKEVYYQPYYCFYIYVGQVQEYVRFYVPAVQNLGTADGEQMESGLKIIDLAGYEFVTRLGYCMDGKFYSIVNGELQEVQELELFEGAQKYGEVYGDFVDEDATVVEVTFYYGDAIALNLTQLMKELIPDKKYDSLNAMYIDGKILIIGQEYGTDASQTDYTTHYLYSIEQNTLTQIMEPTPGYREGKYLYGITYDGGRYATNRKEDGLLWIENLIGGNSVNTGIRNEDIRLIKDASDEHYAVVLQTGEIAVVEKASGNVIKTTKYQMNYEPMFISYRDEMLYIEPDGKLVFVISEFED